MRSLRFAKSVNGSQKPLSAEDCRFSDEIFEADMSGEEGRHERHQGCSSSPSRFWLAAGADCRCGVGSLGRGTHRRTDEPLRLPARRILTSGFERSGWADHRPSDHVSGSRVSLVRCPRAEPGSARWRRWPWEAGRRQPWCEERPQVPDRGGDQAEAESGGQGDGDDHHVSAVHGDASQHGRDMTRRC